MEILALIPARSGSKSVPDKNIRMIGGKPMLAWSIGHALGAGHITRVIVSTDSEEYADIARKFGADVPFIRPAEYATDTALDIDVFKHALTWLEENEGYRPDIIVQLRPTYPKRKVDDIQNMIEMLIDHPEADSVRSVAPATEIPYKMWVCEPAGGGKVPMEPVCGNKQESGSDRSRDKKTDEHDNTAATGSSLGRILPIVKDIPECYNMPRQELPTAYYQNACVDVMRYETVMKKNSMTGDVILGYLMDENYDIDTEAELEKAQKAMPD